MEVIFNKKQLQCLRPFHSQLHSQEQVQEVRIPDAYPDIGKILGCWGQVMIRGKEWRSNYMGANGGVAAWVLYAPEDGTQPRVVDVWIPFQFRWEFPEPADDGTFALCPVLTNLDGRGVSARKIMVRAAVDAFGQGMTRLKTEIATAGEVPDDVQLLTRSYPLEMPIEAGEKQVQMEENLALAVDNNEFHKIISYELSPMITEAKVLGNRLVFRGQANLQMMYMTEDGQISKWETEIPFSQYTELDKDYGPYASAWVLPVVTALEIEMTEDAGLKMRGGIAAQYTIFDREIVDVVEDAFSPKRDVAVKSEDVQLPILLDSTVINMQVEGRMTDNARSIIASVPLSEYPTVSMVENGTEVYMDGQYLVLCQDDEGQMQSEMVRFNGSEPFRSAPENKIELWRGIPNTTEVSPSAEGMIMHTDYPVTMQVYTGQTIPVVTTLELGELKEPDPNRPSVVMRRVGDEGLWAIAKGYGSTVAAIQEANQLNGEPEYGQMLLIPIS